MQTAKIDRERAVAHAILHILLRDYVESMPVVQRDEVSALADRVQGGEELNHLTESKFYNEIIVHHN